MTAPRSLGVRLAVTVVLATTAGCQAPLDPHRDKAAQAQRSSGPSASATATPTPPSSTPNSAARSMRPSDAQTQTQAQAQARANKARSGAGEVIAISVDGLNPSALTQLGAARLPNFFALIHGGASTLNARTELEITETLPNHTGMLTGRPIDGPAGHGIDFNEDPGGVTVSSHAGRSIKSVFDVVHRAGKSTAMYASKAKFALFQRSWGSSMDQTVIDEDDDQLVGKFVAELGKDPATFSFVHLSSPDKSGHAHGFMGAQYLHAVEKVDGLLGRIRAAVAASPTLRPRTTLIVTADHGGRGTHGHSDAAKPDDYRVPFIVTGASARPGKDLYALNPDYRDPGGGRPAYAGAQPVRNGNLADLATTLLGLKPVPGSLFGARDPLDVR